MDLQPQVSFIPKRPLTASTSPGIGSPSILWIIAVIIFAASVIAAVGVFGYKLYLGKKIADAKESLDRARAAYDPTSIEDLIRLNARIEQAKILLAKHISPSAIFTFLEQNTLTTVRFSSFQYSVNPDNSVTLVLGGNAMQFASVALQSDQFGAEVRTLKNVIFSDLNIDPVTGIVSFGIKANINPDLLKFAASESAPETSQPAAESMPGESSAPGAAPPIPPQ